ncbi:hypothetical protein F4776DRAFT_179602 [Hypoxylon sp. NC0597]|nr:hypothetical protein F4776DRAFT_179602 [Hypoxylon sp. NC0597]
MVRGYKEDLLFYIRDIDRYADDGEDTRNPPRALHYLTPGNILEPFEEWVYDPTRPILYVEAPIDNGDSVAIPHELLEELRDRKGLHCTWFFGRARLYFGRDENRINPKTKFLAFLCSMIVQLAALMPDTYDDVTGALTEARFDDLDEMGANMGAIPYSIPKLIEIVKALALLGPTEVFFVFEGCDCIVQGDQDLARQLVNFLGYLATAQPQVSGKVWKTLWIASRPSMPIQNSSGGDSIAV